MCDHGPAAGGVRDVVPGGAGPAGLHQPPHLLPAGAVHPPGRSHRAAGPGRPATGHGGLGQPRGRGPLHRRELLLLPGE